MMDFNTFNSKLFGVFNNAILYSMEPGKLKGKMPDEEYSDLNKFFDDAKKQGYDL